MPQIRKQSVSIVPRDGEIEITININLNVDGRLETLSFKETVETPKDETQILIPDFAPSKKVDFGKEI